MCRLVILVGTDVFCLPAAAEAASGYPLVSSHYVQASTSNSVLYTVWIPDAVTLGTANVSEVSATGQSLGIVATLNDGGIAGDAVAGDRVYSGYLTVSDTSPKTHYYQASYAVQHQIQRTKSLTVLITSLAIVPAANSSAYYTGIGKSFSALLDLFSQNVGLASPQPASNMAAFDHIQQDASFTQLQYAALDAYSPANTATLQLKLRASAQGGKRFWSTIGSFFGLGGLTNKAASEQAIYADLKSANFNPADPAVGNFMAWYNSPDLVSGETQGGDFCGSDINAIPNCRQDNADPMWINYQGWQASKGTSILTVAQNTTKNALVAQAFGPVSDGAGDAITEIYQPSALGYVAVSAATETGTGYLADQFVDTNGNSKVFIGQFGPGQTIQLPSGEHQVLISYLDAARDLVSDVPIFNTLAQLVFNAGASEVYQRQFFPGPFTYTGPMNRSRAFHQATLLNDGRTLVTGGLSFDGVISSGKSAEIYDPASGQWTAIASQMQSYRNSHEATKLADGTVLLTGGGDNSAEIYTPASQSFVPTGAMSQNRSGHVAVMLNDGRVMVVGGGPSTAEIYTPKSGQWLSATSLPSTGSGIFYHRAVLDKGKVLVFGGFDFSSGTTYASVYSFDPGTNVWTTMTPMSVARAEATVALLPDGRVLIVGGGASSSSASNTTEIYDPAAFNSGSGTFGTTILGPTLNQARRGHRMVQFADGSILVVGGDNGCNACNNYFLSSAEYLPSLSATWQQVGPMNEGRYGHTATGMPNGMVVVAGGEGGSFTNTVEMWQGSAPALTQR